MENFFFGMMLVQMNFFEDMDGMKADADMRSDDGDDEAASSLSSSAASSSVCSNAFLEQLISKVKADSWIVYMFHFRLWGFYFLFRWDEKTTSYQNNWGKAGSKARDTRESGKAESQKR